MFDKTKLAGVVGGHLRNLGGIEQMATLLTTGQMPIEDDSVEVERYGMMRRTEHEVDGIKVAVTTYAQVTVQPVTEEAAATPAPAEGAPSG